MRDIAASRKWTGALPSGIVVSAVNCIVQQKYTSLHLSYTLHMTRRARSTISVPVPGLSVFHARKLTHILRGENDQA